MGLMDTVVRVGGAEEDGIDIPALGNCISMIKIDANGCLVVEFVVLPRACCL
jgi:hypothetical protein